jgi:hypothetical protein
MYDMEANTKYNDKKEFILYYHLIHNNISTSEFFFKHRNF